MFTATDVVVGKIAVQLQIASAKRVRHELRELAGEEGGDVSLADRLVAKGACPAARAAELKELAGHFEAARSDAAFLRLLEREAGFSAESVGALLFDLSRKAWRSSVSAALLGAKLITSEQHDLLQARCERAVSKETRQIIARYQKDDFSGVSRGLSKKAKLERSDLTVLKLFGAGLAVAHAKKLRSAARKTAAPTAAPTTAPTAAPTAPLNLEGVKGLKRIADYDVIQLLGAGGMGAVFLGKKDGMGLFVAIKVMLVHAASEAERMRFQREIALGRRVDHDSVMSILDSGETAEGLSYLVVPALVGKELMEHLEAAGDAGLAPDFACRTFENLLGGMQAIHDARIVHRDVKPENVMVLSGGDGAVKIMDFGLARLEGEPDPEDAAASFRTMAGAGEVSGSPPYMSPESISEGEADSRSDIYSLGVLFFQMLTGRLPFESDSVTGYLTQHMAMPPPTLAETRPDIPWPEEAEEFFERLLEKEPGDRPASCREVLEELKGVSAALATMGDPPPAPEPLAPEPPQEDELKTGSSWVTKGLLGRLLGRR